MKNEKSQQINKRLSSASHFHGFEASSKHGRKGSSRFSLPLSLCESGTGWSVVAYVDDSLCSFAYSSEKIASRGSCIVHIYTHGQAAG